MPVYDVPNEGVATGGPRNILTLAMLRALQPRYLLNLGLALVTTTAWAASASPSWGGDPIAPIVAPFPMPQLSRPQFSARVVDIRDHGAVAGGVTKNTAAIAAAIKACADAGGGRVLVPTGQWLTGPIHLRSKIELHLAEGAELVFSDKFEDYLPVVLVRVGGVELYNYSPFIYARDCIDVAITGPGKLNGNSRAWWDWKTKETRAFFEMAARGVPVEKRVFGTPEAAIRPNFVVLFNCRNVLMEGFTIGGGPNWTIHPVYCENVIIRRVHVLTEGPNNDGIDPDSCRNVLVEHCVFDTGDDCLVLKSGYNEDGWRVARPTENVVMRWCTSKRGHGGLVIGSEMSGDVRNVYMHDCDFDGTDRAVRIKSRRDRGGVVEHVTAERLRVRNMQQDVVIMNMDYTADRNQPITTKPPVFRDIHIKDVTCEGAPVAIRLTGLDDSLIDNISFENMTIASAQGVKLTHVQNITFKNVIVTPTTGPVFEFNDARGVTIANGRAPAGTTVFLKASGKDTREVRIDATDLSAAQQKIVLAEGATDGAVVVN